MTLKIALLTVAAALMTVACGPSGATPEEPRPVDPPVVDPPGPGPSDDPADSSGTIVPTIESHRLTSANSDLHVWNIGDEIAVFCSARPDTLFKYVCDATGAGIGAFEGEWVESDTLFAVYPYTEGLLPSITPDGWQVDCTIPAKQGAGGGIIPMVSASTDSRVLDFKPAGVRVDLAFTSPAEDQTIDLIQIVCPGREDLSGPVKVTMSPGKEPVTAETEGTNKKAVDVSCSVEVGDSVTVIPVFIAPRQVESYTVNVRTTEKSISAFSYKPGDQLPLPAWTGRKTATLYPATRTGRVTKYFFYDVKQGNTNPIPADKAQKMFGEFGMNGLRIPIYGSVSNGGHTAPGEVGDGTYTKILQSIAAARAAYGGDDFTIFASKKLDDKSKKESFPTWVKDDNGIIPSKYAVMLFDFVKYMKEQGVVIDVMGIDNEANFNEGNITAEKFAATIDALKPLLEEEGLKVPLFVGHERYNPERQANYWMKQLYDGGWQDRMDIYGTHYYPHHHVADFNSALNKEWSLANSDKARPFWATEPHWDNDDEAKADMLAHAEKAMGAIFDQTDLGMDAFMWWSFKYEGDLRACMMKELSLAVFGSQPIKVNDHDGNGIITLGRLQTRAFIRGNEVFLFIINISSAAYPRYRLKFDGATLNGASAIQWTDGCPIEGSPVTFASTREDNVLLDIPKRSVTKVCFKLAE